MTAFNWIARNICYRYATIRPILQVLLYAIGFIGWVIIAGICIVQPISHRLGSTLALVGLFLAIAAYLFITLLIKDLVERQYVPAQWFETLTSEEYSQLKVYSDSTGKPVTIGEYMDILGGIRTAQETARKEQWMKAKLETKLEKDRVTRERQFFEEKR
ncbi:hypothetical protein [Acidithiobacillus ferrianus]|uniref:hypothetical protein n=1 Tax=Acidithiobacillus ferrianus TaxID=2678518 RepID=UPI0034E51CF2